MKPRRSLQQCVALLRDNSRCGKYAKPGDTLCAVHQPGYTPQGAAVPKPKVLTREERLEMFARSSDPRIAMQAIGLLDRRPDSVSGNVQKTDYAEFIAALTADEKARMMAIMTQWKAFKAEVYTRRPDLK